MKLTLSIVLLALLVVAEAYNQENQGFVIFDNLANERSIISPQPFHMHHASALPIGRNFRAYDGRPLSHPFESLEQRFFNEPDNIVDRPFPMPLPDPNPEPFIYKNKFYPFNPTPGPAYTLEGLISAGHGDGYQVNIPQVYNQAPVQHYNYNGMGNLRRIYNNGGRVAEGLDYDFDGTEFVEHGYNHGGEAPAINPNNDKIYGHHHHVDFPNTIDYLGHYMHA